MLVFGYRRSVRAIIDRSAGRIAKVLMWKRLIFMSPLSDFSYFHLSTTIAAGSARALKVRNNSFVFQSETIFRNSFALLPFPLSQQYDVSTIQHERTPVTSRAVYEITTGPLVKLWGENDLTTIVYRNLLPAKSSYPP